MRSCLYLQQVATNSSYGRYRGVMRGEGNTDSRLCFYTCTYTRVSCHFYKRVSQYWNTSVWLIYISKILLWRSRELDCVPVFLLLHTYSIVGIAGATNQLLGGVCSWVSLAGASWACARDCIYILDSITNQDN